jgi:hypothetical protein
LKCSHEAGCSTHFFCVAHIRRLIAPLANVSLAAPPDNVSCSELGVVCTWMLETLWLSFTIAADLCQAKEPTSSNSSSSCVRFPQNSHQGDSNIKHFKAFVFWLFCYPILLLIVWCARNLSFCFLLWYSHSTTTPKFKECKKERIICSEKKLKPNLPH